MGTVQRADPEARRKGIWIICVVMLLGFSAILAFEYVQEDFQTWLEANIDFLLDNTFVVFVASLLFVSPLLAVGIYLLLLGKRIVRTQRFPPPGQAVIRDTAVQEGQQAIWRGRVIQLLALLVLGSVVTIPIIMWYVFRSLNATT